MNLSVSARRGAPFALTTTADPPSLLLHPLAIRVIYDTHLTSSTRIRTSDRFVDELDIHHFLTTH